MDWKDYALITAAVLLLAGPLGVHFYYRGKGRVQKGPQGDNLIDDNRRIGTMLSLVGGRALSEGAKLQKRGALRYANDQDNKAQQQVGGA
jgi:hypothetical protein